MGETLAMAPNRLKGDQMVAFVVVLDWKYAEITSDVGEENSKVEGTIKLRGGQFR